MKPYLECSYLIDGAEISPCDWKYIRLGLLKPAVEPRFWYDKRRKMLQRWGAVHAPLFLSNRPEGSESRRYYVVKRFQQGWRPVYHLNRRKPNRLLHSELVGTVYLCVR